MTSFTGALIYGMATWGTGKVFLNWQPQQADSRQLKLEHDAEVATALARGALACLATAALLGLIGIALAWHRVIPGAMCGTGVLQAMGSYGGRAMVFWMLTLILLSVWQVMDRLNRCHPMGPLTLPAARVWLTAAPLLLPAFFFSWQALMRVDTSLPVSCCAAVYDRVLAIPSNWTASGNLLALCLWGHLAGSAALMISAFLFILRPKRTPGVMPLIVVALWIPAAFICVKQIWSAYYYHVLSHPCPWCLFLSDSYHAGFLIFGAMAAAVQATLEIRLTGWVRSRHSDLSVPAVRRIRQSAWRVLAAIVLFTVLTCGPALSWRLKNGVWITGLF